MSDLNLKKVDSLSAEDAIGHWQPAFRPNNHTTILPDSNQPKRVEHGNAPEPIESTHKNGYHDHEEEENPEEVFQSRTLLQDLPVEYEPDHGPLSTIIAAYPETSVLHQETAAIPVKRLAAPEPATRIVSWATEQPKPVYFDHSELSSDEDEERLDPAWGIKRTDSAQILHTVTRTASFPAFGSALNSPAVAHFTPLPPSQAEDVMQESEQTTEEQVKNEEVGSRSILQDDLESWNRPTDDFIEQLNPSNQEQQEISDKEARFEEGMPLIPTESATESKEASQVPEEQKPVDDIFTATDDDPETSFFDEVRGTEQPPPLDRKTTAHVLETLNSLPSAPSDSPPLRSTQTEYIVVEEVEPQLTAAMVMEEATLSAPKEDVDAVWQAALDSDDDEFLVEDADDLLPDSAPDSPSSFIASLQNGEAHSLEPDEFLSHLHSEPEVQKTPPSAGRGQHLDFARQPSSNPYAPHQPSTSDLTQLSPTTYGNVGLSRPVLAPMNSFQQQLQQRPAPPVKTESFVDQKGGYKSPYDLPMDLAKPRKRPQIQQPLPSPRGLPPPPPRSSSISSDKQLQSPFSPTFPSGQGMTTGPPPAVAAPRSTSLASPPKQTPPVKSTGFFEELPMSSRPRPTTGHGRYTPQQNTSMPPPQLFPQSPPSLLTQPPPPAQANVDPYAQYQLRAPEKLDPYANVPLQVPTAPLNAATSTRYSPAPPAVGGIRPSPSPRYSPAPPPQAAPAGRYASQPVPPTGSAPLASRYSSQTPPVAQASAPPLPFQPRNSSPLAYHGRSISEEQEQAVQSRTYMAPPQLASQYAPAQIQNNGVIQAELPQPRRSQTQSPSQRRPPPSMLALMNNDAPRSSSVPQPPSPTKATMNAQTILPPRPSVRQRGFSQNFNFIEPTDGQELDSLQRWKGAPVFRFAFGGAAVSSFPKHTPRYSAGSTTPMIKPSAGEIHVRNAIDLIPLAEHVVTFPGPLRSKSKKKDVIAWLASRITSLEQEHLYRGTQYQFVDSQIRHDEKILLWKIVQALVENDGVLEGAVPQKTISTILTPEIHALDETTATQYGASGDTSGIYRPRGSTTHAETVDPVVVESIRKQLLRGERDKAVWTAVDKRLWAHALLISSTLDRSVWKQVVQEFVRQEVKIIGANTESLAALYEVFAGNTEESIDELVPPSARAGLQMVSKTDITGPTKNALDGLNRWKETLALILSNRTADDTQALAALGGLLLRYGRTEAAHICHLFARGPSQPGIFGGADDPNASIVLLGVDHRTPGSQFFRDDDSMLLTEVYEFAFSILAGSPTAAMPYLQIYKLQRAATLADSGRKVEAQAYCDVIAGSLKSTTKMSPYFNAAFFAELEELSGRLKQVPVQNSSWIAKPSIERVSGSVWNKFSSFVAGGDDSDADSKGSGKDANYEFGPFAKVSGTPSISRSGSSSDLYGNYPKITMPQAVPTTSAGSRYAPNGANTARSSSDLTRGKPSLDSQRSPPSGHSPRPPHDSSSSFGQASYMPQANMYQPMGQSPPTNRYQATPPQTSYIPSQGSPQNSYTPQESYIPSQDSPQNNYAPPRQDSYIPTPPPEQVQSSYMPIPTQTSDPLPPPPEQPSFGGYASVTEEEPSGVQEGENSYTTSYDAPSQSYGYEPPTDTGYVPYRPDPEDSETESKQPEPAQKKAFVDDDGDDFPRISTNYAPAAAAPPMPSEIFEDDASAKKRANDAAADAAFRAAAEADAAKDKERTVKPKASGWFDKVPSIGLFAKKETSLDSGSKGNEPKVYKAKLGEAKMSLFYDEKLKKWVDPNNPDSMKPKAGPAPPPRMGPSRNLTPSMSMPVLSGGGSRPPSGPSSRAGTPADGPPPMGTPPMGLGSGLAAPPSRPTTGMSNASSIDDLLGPAVPGQGRRTIKGKKGAKGRYIDVMQK